MHEVYVLVEGETEQAVIASVLSEWLCDRGVFLHPIRAGKRGGTRSFERVGKDVRNLLKQHPAGRVSTLFDFYGLGDDWPGMRDARSAATPAARSRLVTQAMHDAVRGLLPDCDPRRFLPYVQMHELEALLFADADATAGVLPAMTATQILAIRDAFDTCEHINHTPTGAPSKRLPGYRKGKGVSAHAVPALRAARKEVVRTCCPLFAAWLDDLARS